MTVIRQFALLLCLFCLIIRVNSVFAKDTTPLTENEIENTLASFDLDFVLSDVNTLEKDHHSFILRDKQKKYIMSPDNVVKGVIISSVFDNKRYLEVTFYSDPDQYAELPLKWEEWKNQIDFTSGLWGSFSEPDVLYNSLADLETGAGKDLFIYDEPVEQSYLEIQYSMLPTTFTDEETINRSLMITFRLYEHYQLYEAIKNQLEKAPQ